MKAARFESIPAQNQSVQHTHTVPGRLRYDETKHVDVKAPMDGILAEVQVTPGVLVESGQLLAVLCSPEIGRAQAEAYAKLFAIFRKHEDVIERVTFWGLNDRRTWRFGQHPLIFDSNNHPKPAYAAIVNEPSRD